MLLKTLSLVKEEIPNIHLTLIGDGSLQNELKQLAYHLELSQNITWHGRIPYQKMPNLYRQSHLYLQTSRHESQGMAVLEAMACGLPALGTPVGVTKSLACKPAHISEKILAGQVVEIFRDEASYAQVRQQVRHIIEEEFSLPVTINKFLYIYSQIVL